MDNVEPLPEPIFDSAPSDTFTHFPSSSSSTPPPILFDTLVLLALRVIFFILSRRFLSTLNPTLRDLSKPETLLPVPALDGSTPGEASLHTQVPGSHSLSDADPDADMDDTDADASYATTPGSTRPSSPAAGAGVRGGRDGFGRRGTDDYFNHNHTQNHSHQSSGSLGGSSREAQIELQNLGHRIKDAAGKKVQVLQLAHGRSVSAVGTKNVKRAARGLNHIARVLFSLCFAESCNLITIVIFHTMGVLHSRSRHFNFSVSLHALLGMILIAVPLVQCLLLTYRSRESTSSTTPSRLSSLSLSSRLLISLIPFTLYIFLFTRIPPYITALPLTSSSGTDVLTDAGAVNGSTGVEHATIDDKIAAWSASGPEGWEGGGWLATTLGRVVVLGVVVLAGLSGFGAVRAAWDFLEHAAGASSRPVSDHDILQAERSLYRVRHDLVAKRDDLNRLSASAVEGNSNGWMGRMFGSKGDQEVAALQAEIKGLSEMEGQVSRSLAAMKLRKKRQGSGGTMKGVVYNLLGYVFAFYCVARLVMCIISLFTPLSTSIPTADTPKGKGNTNGDWISFLLALGLSHLPSGTIDIDVAVLSRTISLSFTGLLILSSLALVLRNLIRMLRLTSKTVGAGFLLLFLGQLFATYCISLLVQLRTYVPASAGLDTDPFSADYDPSMDPTTVQTVVTDDSLLRSLPDFQIFGRLFDAVFLLAAVGTVVYRYVAMRVAGGPDEGMFHHM